MAKEIAIGKRAKISEAQQYMLLAVLGASLFLGAGISLTVRFIQQISFNSRVIAAEEQAIVAYSDTIQTIGICERPSGKIYSDRELANCDPDAIEVSQVPGSLRSEILENLAANSALNSVPKESESGCTNADGKAYSYKELNQLMKDASGTDAKKTASALIQKCSALRIIPDALPAFQNEEGLFSSLNKVFIASNIEPESFSPGGNTEELEGADGFNIIPIAFSIENTTTGTVTTLLHNIERSIREFDIHRAHLEWAGGISLQADATAYYMDESVINETTQTITAEEN